MSLRVRNYEAKQKNEIKDATNVNKPIDLIEVCTRNYSIKEYCAIRPIKQLKSKSFAKTT